MRRFPRRNDENDKTRLVRDFPPLEKRTFKTDGGKFKNLGQMRQIAVEISV